MATFTNVTRGQMAAHLEPQGFKVMAIEGVIELVWGKVYRIDDVAVSMRIYTGINPTGESRDVGKDAIRVCFFYRNAFSGEIRRVGGTKRVHRVKGWKTNLQSRIDGWREQLGPLCPKCGALTALRKPKGDAKWQAFYGCTNYPNCKGTIRAAA